MAEVGLGDFQETSAEEKKIGGRKTEGKKRQDTLSGGGGEGGGGGDRWSWQMATRGERMDRQEITALQYTFADAPASPLGRRRVDRSWG